MPPGAFPPPPGAPGPGYLPPPYPPIGGPRPTPEVLTAGDTPSGSPTTGTSAIRLGAVLIGVAFVIVLAVVGFVAASSSDEENTAAAPEPAPTRSVQTPASPESTPTTGPSSRAEPGPSSQPSASAEPSAPADPRGGPRLLFRPLPPPWSIDPGAASAVGADAAQTAVTEPDYQPGQNWVALAASGLASSEWYDADDLAASAEKAAEWFAKHNFVGAELTRETRSRTPFEVDGKKAHLLEQHFSYQIEGLRAQGETVYIAVVDLGDGKGGVFIGSVPDTHPKLVRDVQKAIESLTVIG